MKLLRWVGEGEMVPRGYGLAWRDFATCRTFVLPVPLNLIVGWARWVWLALQFRLAPQTDARIREWRAGYEDGCEQADRVLGWERSTAFRAGYDAAFRVMELGPAATWGDMDAKYRELCNAAGGR